MGLFPASAVLLGAVLGAQAPEGSLRFAAGGRTVTFSVVGGGHQAFVTLGPAAGLEARARLFLLAHSGPERMIVPASELLKEKAPAAWKVSHRGDRGLVRTPEATYWRYTPGLVLPVRFRLDGQEWRLESAQLPPKMFVSAGDR